MMIIAVFSCSFTFKVAFLYHLMSGFYCVETPSSSVIVDSPFGKIRGVIVEGDSGDQSYVAFWNIPYAKPPIGKLRFAKPEPHPKLDDVFEACNRRLVSCIHPKSSSIHGLKQDQGSEDCLILNIFAKNVNKGHKLKKVVVYIHGGVFLIGSSGPLILGSFVKTHDVIGVTINYRLGVLGFLSTGNEASPGNYGLWDQTLAMQWVKDNIEAFGGDPNDVTVAGGSAGGASVAYQCLSPVAKGLFTKAFPHSGGATSIYVRSIDVQKNALTVAKHANCWKGEVTDRVDLRQSESIMECLRNVDVSVIASYPAMTIFSETPFAPSVDGDFVPRKPSLLLQDESYLESIGFYDRNYLVSFTNEERAVTKLFMDFTAYTILSNNQTTQEDREKMVSAFHDGMRDFFVYTRLDIDDNLAYSAVVESALDFYKRRYVGNDVYVELITDLTIVIPVLDFLNAASRQKKCKSWLLYFNHFPAYMKGAFRGIPHGGDQMYWFDKEATPLDLFLGIEGGMQAEDLQLKAMYSSLIAEFMKNGDPALALTDYLPEGWPVYEADCSNYLNFNPEPTVRYQLEAEKQNLWFRKLPALVQMTQKTIGPFEL